MDTKFNESNSRWRGIILIVASPIFLVWLVGLILNLSDNRDYLLRPAQLAEACALVSFLTSAILQIAKDHAHIRAWAHETALGNWLKERFTVTFVEGSRNSWGPGNLDPAHIPELIDQAKEEIEKICAAGAPGRKPFYDLSTRQFCGQIATAVDLVMLDPGAYPEFFAALTSGDEAHLKMIIEYAMLADGPIAALAENERFERLRVKVTNYAQRALDGLQIEASRRWKSVLLIAGGLVSLALSFSVVMNVLPPSQFGDHPYFYYTVAMCTVAGTLFAPLAYDITSAIRAWGRR